jgi:hypothetical protein
MTSIAQRNWTHIFNWIGVAMTLAFLAVVLAGNTELVWRFEHTGFPLSWVFAGAAILAFMATEFCDSVSSLPDEAEDRVSELSPEWETVEPLV